MTVQLTVPHLKSNMFKESRCVCVCGWVLFRNAGATQGVNRKGMQHLCLANDELVRLLDG